MLDSRCEYTGIPVAVCSCCKDPDLADLDAIEAPEEIGDYEDRCERNYLQYGQWRGVVGV